MSITKTSCLLSVLSSFATTLTSCLQTAPNTFVFTIRSDALGPQKGSLADYTKALQSEVETLQATKNAQYDLTPFAIQAHVVQDQTTILDDLASSKSSFGYVNAKSAAFYQHPNSLVPAISTLTNSFMFDHDATINYAKDQGASLMKVAREINQLFNQTPYAQWSNDLHGRQKWNGSTYQFLYDPIHLVDFYRGTIYLWGTQTELAKMKAAWANKNWSQFLSYGIMAGKPTSAGKYLLQQRLLNEHFKQAEPINLLQLSQASKTSSKVLLNQKGRDLGIPHPNFHIVFDDMNSFAWTKNTQDKLSSDKHSARVIKYFDLPANNKMEVFMLTDPLPYDIGLFSKSVNMKRQKLITDAIINLYQNHKDQYGPSVGYNGYRHLEPHDWYTNWVQQIKLTLVQNSSS